jgi:hypothetical protein
LLLEQPRRYGRLPGWQIGKRLFFSKKRKAANRLLFETTEIARQGFFMQRKIDRTEKHERQELEERIAALKAEQAKAMQAPPEGRLILQYALYEVARRLTRESWGRLNRSERYHLTQARQLMKYEDLRGWADERVRQLIAEAVDTTEINVSPLQQSIDLREISPAYHKTELDRLWREMKQAQQQETTALQAMQAHERDAMTARRAKVIEQGFIALLVRGAGLSHLFEFAFTRQRRKLSTRNDAASSTLAARQEQVRKKLSAQYQVMRERKRKLEERKRLFDENRREITSRGWRRKVEDMRENAADITEPKCRRRSSGDERRQGKHSTKRKRVYRPKSRLSKR